MDVNIKQCDAILNVPTYPELSGLNVSINVAATQTVVVPNLSSYHLATLVITLGVLDTLAIQGRMADGSTVGFLTAIGPAGTRVVLNTTNLVPANNGLYLLDRFDIYDMLFVYTMSTGPLSVQGRLGVA